MKGHTKMCCRPDRGPTFAEARCAINKRKHEDQQFLYIDTEIYCRLIQSSLDTEKKKRKRRKKIQNEKNK